MFQAQVVLTINLNEHNLLDYKNLFKEDSYIYPIHSEELQEAYEIINKYEPDLILIYDTLKENVADICSTIRSKTSGYRPVIMVMSESEDINKKMDILRSGADDYQSEHINQDELSLRIFAHLRRHVEELAHPASKIPGSTMTYKTLRRSIELKKDDQLAIMYIDIDNFKPYKEIYGYIAAEKLIQTFVAIIKTSINEQDFLGQIGEDLFILMTSPQKAEKIAMFLSYSFDMVSPKFYSSEDLSRGYLIISGDEKVGRRIPLVSISIGIASNQYVSFQNFQEALGKSMNVHRLAKSKPGSSWVSDRPKLCSEETCTENTQQKILVVESDAALAYLLTTTLEMQGYTVDTTSSFNEIMPIVEEKLPNLVVMDINNESSSKELEICRTIKEKYPLIKVIVSTVDRDKEKVLNAGADLYIPKPYELMILFNWISKFLNYELN